MDLISILSFIIFTALVAGISYYVTRSDKKSTSDGYFLGGRSLTGPVIAGSLILTNISTEQIVGLNGGAFREGILVMGWETLAALAMVITGLFLLPRYLKGGITTIPQFLERRYDTLTKTVVSGLFLTGYAAILLPIVLYSGALAISTMFDVPGIFGVSKMGGIWICVWGIGIIGSIYAIFGGLKVVAVSDTINAIGLFTGGLLIPIFGLLALGEGSVVDGITLMFESHPERFNAIGDSGASIPFTTIFTGMMLVQMFYWGTNQAIIQRALAAKSLEEGQKGVLFGAVIKIFGPIIVVLPGMIAYQLYGNTLTNGDEAYPMLVSDVLPKYLLGFFAAVLVGAILSSFNSALNSAVTLFSIDIYKTYFNKNASDQKTISTGKRFGIVLAVLSMFIAPMIAKAPQGLFGYLQEVNGCYSIPILTIVIVGYLTKRVPAFAARIAIFSGVILYILSQFVLKTFFFEEGNYPHYLHVMAILFVVNVVLMLALGKLYPRKEAYVQHYTYEVDITPWRYAKTTGIAISVFVICIYLFFSGIFLI